MSRVNSTRGEPVRLLGNERTTAIPEGAVMTRERGFAGAVVVLMLLLRSRARYTKAPRDPTPS